MKYGIISDIHSNITALDKVIACLKAMDVFQIYCCGDIIGYGHDSTEVVQRVIEDRIKSVCGNHEKAMYSQEAYQWMNDRAKNAINQTMDTLSDELQEYIAGLPDFLVENKFRLVHGTPPDSVFKYLDEVYRDDSKKIFSGYREKITFCGHTHVPALITYDNKEVSDDFLIEYNQPYSLKSFKRAIVNVGSVSEPRDTDMAVSRFVVYDHTKETVTFFVLVS